MESTNEATAEGNLTDQDAPFMFGGYTFPFSVADVKKRAIARANARSVGSVGEASGIYQKMEFLMYGDSMAHAAPELPLKQRQRALDFLQYAASSGAKEADDLLFQTLLFQRIVDHFVGMAVLPGPEEASAAPPRRERGEQPTSHKIKLGEMMQFRQNIMGPFADRLMRQMVAFSETAITIKCPECGENFTPERIGQIYDKRTCADRAGQRRRYHERKSLASKNSYAE